MPHPNIGRGAEHLSAMADSAAGAIGLLLQRLAAGTAALSEQPARQWRPTNRHTMAPTRTQPDRQAPPSDTGHLPLPHERDETTGPGNTTGTAPRKVMDQARKDLEAGLVDTDMRSTPGVDAERRDELVPTPTSPRKP